MRAYGEVSSDFDLATGVRQGGVLESVLFNLFLDMVIAATLCSHPSSGVRVLLNLGDSGGF